MAIFTEAASCAIVTFLEMDSSETTGNGWMLLTALNLLSCGNQALIDCMTAASLPSTLVKCLYLFFDLPEIEDPDKCNPNSEFTAEERRALLQKIWVQVCSFMLFLLYSVHYWFIWRKNSKAWIYLFTNSSQVGTVYPQYMNYEPLINKIMNCFNLVYKQYFGCKISI